MPEPIRVAVIGGGVAGLSAAWHFIELWTAERRGDVPPLELHVVSMLAPHPGGPGSGLGGKAMSRAFEGWIDADSGYDRRAFYGPLMPWSGCVPHGYHIMWEYPNLRRMLGDDGTGRDLHLVPPHGASHLGAFQGILDDPSPGGPGVAIIGLCDPRDPTTARTDAGAALLRLGGTPLLHPFLSIFERLFGHAVPEADPLVFADMFFTHEIDVELRLGLVGATLAALAVDPESTLLEVDGEARTLGDVEYDAWAADLLDRWLARLGADVPEEGWLWDSVREWQRTDSLVRLAEALVPAEDPIPDSLRDLLPSRWRVHFDDLRLVLRELERFLREVPLALGRLATGRYPAWRTLHFRFAPDATFASPFSFDAAQAVRSLVLCYRNPRAARMWSVDGQRWHGLWSRFWERLERGAHATRGGVSLHIHEGRVVELEEGPLRGHGGPPLEPAGSPPGDLGMPHTPSLAEDLGAPAEEHRIEHLHAVVPTCSPGALRALLPGAHWEGARTQLAPVCHPGTETVEVVIWLAERIEWSPLVREALSTGAIGGLEGPFCMLADYACGLWTPETFAAERPFEGDDEPFRGSILESCGGLADLYACQTRDDAYGWPEAVKSAVAALLGRPDHFAERDARPWPHDEHGWRSRRVDGTWTADRAGSAGGWEDWIVAARWLVFGYLRQLSLIQALGGRAVRQLGALAELLDPRGCDRAEIVSPPEHMRRQVRYVVMRNTKARNRFYNPGVGEWRSRPISGLPLVGTERVFPAGDWTRNGLDVVCMEAACLSAMRATRGAWGALRGGVPTGAPAPIPVLPPHLWYSGTDPHRRGA